MGTDKEAARAEETATRGNKTAEETKTKMKGNGEKQGSFIIPRPARLHPGWMAPFHYVVSQSHNYAIGRQK